MDGVVVWETMNSLRLKVTDRCPWSCWWCHNEGTGPRDPNQIGDIFWDQATSAAIEAITSELGLVEVHLTGGEPTAHPRLSEVIAGLRGLGLKVKATSMGCNEVTLEEIIASGLESINFSLHALDAAILHGTQIARTPEWTESHLGQQLRAIVAARDLGVNVKINTVLASVADIDRVTQVVHWAQLMGIPIRILNEFQSGQASYDAIHQLLVGLDASELYSKYIVGSSGFSTFYLLSGSYVLTFKQARNNYLAQSMCSGCELMNTVACGERFYVVRLEKRRVSDDWQLFVRLCIHRTSPDTVMPVANFLKSQQLAEIKELMKMSLGRDIHVPNGLFKKDGGRATYWPAYMPQCSN